MSARTRTSILLCLSAAITPPMVGCAGDAAPGPSHTVTDSAGIEIVHSHRPAWSPGEGWQVSPEPRLEIGRQTGEDPYILDRVMGVTVLDDGGVVVAHMGDNTLRFYDAEGAFVRQVGGTGGGPEEFRQVMGLLRHGDEIWGRQWARHPNKVFDREGNFLRAVTTSAPPDMPVPSLWGVFDDGSLLVADWPQTGTPTPEPRIVTSTVLRDLGDRLDTLTVLPAVRLIPLPGNSRGMYQEFSPRLGLTTDGYAFYHAFPEHYEVTRRDTAGAIVRIIRRDWEPIPVTDEHIEQYAETTVNARTETGDPVPPRLREQRRAIVEAQIHPEHHPAFERMVTSRTGRLWIERADPDHPKVRAGFPMLRDTPTSWDVFDPDGVWLGAVDLPARFFPYEFGQDYIAGVWKDENDVEYVRVYGLTGTER